MFLTGKQEKRRNLMNQMKGSLKQRSIIGQQTNKLEMKLEQKKHYMRVKPPQDEESTICSLPENDKHLEEGFENSNSFEEKYILGDKIGEGANGTVYKCSSKLNQETYAVKIFSMDEDQHLKEIKRNFISIKNLKHKSVISYKALYFDFQKHLAFLVMEYYPYDPILKFANQATLIRIIKLLLDSLKYLHNHNICHRDIKPENILYDPLESKIKIIDFGISKKTFQRGFRREMCSNIGTPLFMAPQVLNGGGYDERIDLWALGVTIYKTIADVTPFESEYHSQTVQNILKGDLKFDQPIWKEYSPFAQDFITRFLKKQDQRMTILEAENHIWLKQSEWKVYLLNFTKDNFQKDKNRPRQVSSNEVLSRVDRIDSPQKFKNARSATTWRKNEQLDQECYECQPKTQNHIDLVSDEEFDLDSAIRLQNKPL